MKKLAKVLPVGLMLPGIALAQANFSWFTGVVDGISTLVTSLIPVVIAIGLLFFIWGLVQFIASSGDEGAKEEGKRKMIWGIVALFVIVSVWGIVSLLADIVGVSGVTNVNPPGTPGL